MLGYNVKYLYMEFCYYIRVDKFLYNKNGDNS